MPLSAVRIDASLQLFNLAYALSTEDEEVMCLLLGEWGGAREDVATIRATSVMKRIDKRRDRVEISPETLVAASEGAERLGLRVVGWFHSHPHITVLPSHVDLRTQWNMQYLDHRFVGLIMSCFNADSEFRDRVQMIAFQSSNSSPPELVEVPLEILPSLTATPHTLEQFHRLSSMFLSDSRSNFLRPFLPAAAQAEPSSPTYPQSSDPFQTPLLQLLPRDATLPLVHAAASYAGTLAEVVDRITGPTAAMLLQRKQELLRRIGELEEKKKRWERGEILEGEWSSDEEEEDEEVPANGPDPARLAPDRARPSNLLDHSEGEEDDAAWSRRVREELVRPMVASQAPVPGASASVPASEADVAPRPPSRSARPPAWVQAAIDGSGAPVQPSAGYPAQPLGALASPPAQPAQASLLPAANQRPPTAQQAQKAPGPPPPPRLAVPPPSQLQQQGALAQPAQNLISSEPILSVAEQVARLSGGPPPPPRVSVPPPGTGQAATAANRYQPPPPQPPPLAGPPPQPQNRYQPPPGAQQQQVPPQSSSSGGSNKYQPPPPRSDETPSAPPGELMPPEEGERKGGRETVGSWLRKLSPSRK
ncbi:JAB1/Mov34/MPN/PAD-1 ubiquitin protease-domain-containing protein [Hyaloraphidium curvatum]|nr:JAB1/Mov34/MPN/PAD-1 ubiquitin protease-domain-containing protein [Hyaloraphidium curvatum]